MGRFARSWDLTKTSFKVVRQDKELLWMPVLSALASLIAIAAIAGVGIGTGLWPQTENPDGSANYAGAALAFLLYIALAFVSLFFNAAVVAAANERLGGGDPTVGSALRAAAGKAGKLFLWAIVVATVNVLLQAIRERSGIVGQILTSLAGTAWNLATYFMVPVLLFDDKAIGSSLKRSGGLFKQTWGETVIGQGGLGLAGFVVGLVVVLVGFALLFLLSPLGIVGIVAAIAIAGLALVATIALFSVLEGVYKAALYRYATTQQVAPGFTSDQVGGAFVQR
ncbi:MAG: DUF6159 family protein [Candidatus Thermoplasmatota archaeon]